MSETESESGLAPDPVLLDARDQARAALAEITDPASIGDDNGHEVEEAHVLTLFFECRLAGYPGWRWAATLARTSEDAPVTVLEVELLPGPDSVIAPDWVPWSERLAQYREGHAKQGDDGAADAESDELDDAGDELDGDFEDELDGADIDDDGDFGADDAESDVDDDSDDDDSDDDDESDDDDSDDDDADEDIDDDADDTALFDEDSDDVDDDDDSDEDEDDDDDDDDDDEDDDE